MSIVDTIIRELAPRAYAKRMQSKTLGDVYRQRSYDAAAKSRRTSGWHATGTSINAENRLALSDLRARSRELVRNNPYAKKAIQVLTANVVGVGIRPVAKVDGKRAQKIVRELWRKWAETTACDHYGQQNFYGLQAQVMKALARDGEVLIRKRKQPSSISRDVPVKLQVLEADYIASHYEYPYIEKTGGYTIQGIEFSEKGERVSYWLYDSHPGDTFRRNITPKQVPADEIIHVYRVDRPGQVRGIPEGASAMLRLHDLDDYEDAQLMKQKVAACFAAFVTNDPNMDTPIGSSTDLAERIEPGIIEYLPPGKQVAFASPPTVDGYDEYMKVMLRAIAAGYGVTYEAITGDLSNVNFSSGRMGWLEFHRNITEWQNHVLIPMFCNPSWSWFIEAAVIAGTIPDNVSSMVDWTPPRREMIDPTKEVKAQIEAIQGGITSWQEVARENGHEPDQLMEQIREDMESFDRNSLVLSCDYRKNPQVMTAQAEPADNTKAPPGSPKAP